MPQLDSFGSPYMKSMFAIAIRREPLFQKKAVPAIPKQHHQSLPHSLNSLVFTNKRPKARPAWSEVYSHERKEHQLSKPRAAISSAQECYLNGVLFKAHDWYKTTVCLEAEK